MDKVVNIIKFLFSLKKNPFLYFSGILVTSGTFLLSKGILEIILNAWVSNYSERTNEIGIENIYVNFWGTALIVTGILLFYLKFLKKEKVTIEYKNDSSVIKYIFSEITSLNKLDYVIDQALYPYLIESSLYDHEHMENYLLSSNYHVYDTELRELIQKFYEDWSKVCSHWQAFTLTNVPDKLRPNTYMDIARTEDVELAIDEVPAFAKDMHKSLKKLISYIKTNYRNIEI